MQSRVDKFPACVSAIFLAALLPIVALASDGADSRCDDAAEIAEVPDLAQVTQTLSTEIEQLRASTGIPSVSIVLMRDGEIVWS